VFHQQTLVITGASYEGNGISRVSPVSAVLLDFDKKVGTKKILCSEPRCWRAALRRLAAAELLHSATGECCG
jgi:hypothetical protein